MSTDWFGQLPRGWLTRRLKTISPVMRGASPRPIDDPLYFDDEGEFAWVRISDVTASNGLLETTTQRLSALGSTKSVKLTPGKLFLSIAGSVGKPCITGIKACIHDGFVYFPYMPQESQRFIYWMFESRECFSGLGKLGTQLNLNTESVGNIAVPFPPLDTQQLIATYLDNEIARIDQLIEKRERFIQMIDERRASLAATALNGSILEESPGGVKGWFGSLPETWQAKRAKFLFRERPARSQEGDEELLTVSHISGVTKRSEKDVNMFMAESMEGYKIVSEGDVVINTMWAWMGAMGVSPIDGITSPSYGVYSPIIEIFEREYLDLLLRSRPFIAEATRRSKGIHSSRLRLYPDAFLDILFPVPSRESQQAILTALKAATEKEEKLAALSHLSLARLREFRAALIAAAVTGRIDVSTWRMRNSSDLLFGSKGVELTA